MHVRDLTARVCRPGEAVAVLHLSLTSRRPSLHFTSGLLPGFTVS